MAVLEEARAHVDAGAESGRGWTELQPVASIFYLFAMDRS
jgi:hypothetical protein